MVYILQCSYLHEQDSGTVSGPVLKLTDIVLLLRRVCTDHQGLQDLAKCQFWFRRSWVMPENLFLTD